ncbi:hypothetical protein ACLOJK_005007 [Asimina triloba]
MAKSRWVETHLVQCSHNSRPNSNPSAFTQTQYARQHEHIRLLFHPEDGQHLRSMASSNGHLSTDPAMVIPGTSRLAVMNGHQRQHRPSNFI